MQYNSGNSSSLVYVYRNYSNTLNTEMTLRNPPKKKSKTDDKLACCLHNNPLQLLISYSHSAEGETADGCHQAAIQPTTQNKYTHNSIMPSHNNTTTHTRTQQYTKVF